MHEGYLIDPDRPPSLRAVVARWKKGHPAIRLSGMKYHAYYPLAAVRKVPAYNRMRYKPGSQKFETLVKSLRNEGMREPILIVVDRHGHMITGQGNHRLQAAKYAGMQKVPVRFAFWQTIQKQGIVRENPRLIFSE